MGMFDGATAADADRGLLALFLVAKLVVMLAWLLASIRLAADPGAPRLLRLDRRQLLWLAALLLLMPFGLAARFLIQKLLGTLLAPLALDPRAILLMALLVYLATFLYLQVRLVPALIGVLLGDGEAGLGWSWRGTRGIASAFLITLILAILPLFALHFGNSLIWLPEQPLARLAVLLLDGAVMAALLLVGSAVYVALYRKAKASAADRAGSALAPAAG